MMEAGEMRTCLSFEDCADRQIATWKDYLGKGIFLGLGNVVEGEAWPFQGMER
jgi:hypothetical protein